MGTERRVLLLATIGNRDLMVDGQPIPPEQIRPRGEEIARDFDSYRERLAAPLLEPCLRYIRDRGSADRPVRLRIRLFGTDQGAGAGRHSLRDTIHLARAVAKLLPQRFPPEGRFSIMEEPKATPVLGNPSLYDEMYRRFGEILAGRNLEPDQFEEVYVAPVGGTPAMSFGLTLQAIQRYGPKCELLYVAEGRSSAVKLQTGRQILASSLRAVIREQLERYEFGRAATLLRTLPESEAGATVKVLASLAEYADARLAFDFEKAKLILEDEVIATAQGEARELGMRLRDDLEPLLGKELKALIQELYHNTRLTLRAGRYVDALLRLFRLVEAALRFVVEQELRLPTEADGARSKREFREGIERRPELKARFEQPYEGERLDYTRPPDRRVLRLLLDSVIESGAEHCARYEEFRAVVKRLEPLAQLRNRSIGGHGFEGVSREKIEHCTGSLEALECDLERLVQLVVLEAGASPFDELRNFLLQQLG